MKPSIRTKPHNMAKNYKGRLTSPLPQEPDLLTSEDYEADLNAYREEVADRIDLLFDHYGIEQSDPAAWQKLAVALAQCHVKGLKPHTPKGNPDRKVQIFLQMLYLRAFRSLSEKQAAQTVSDLSPELGKPDAIRSAFREVEFHPSYRQLLTFFGSIEEGIGSETLRLALRAGIGDLVDDLDQVSPKKRGRVRKT